MTNTFKGLAGMLMSVAVIGLTATQASASTITLFSDGGNGEWNSQGDTIAISQHPGWAAPFAGSSWVSYTPTGNPSAPGYYVVPNGTVINFYESFFLGSGPATGWLSVMADDSASVYLNGIQLFAEAPQNGNTYATCSDFTIGCQLSTSVTLNLTPLLQEGNNDLLFQVAQRHSASLGLNYVGEVNQVPEVPEPASMVLIGTGLLGIAARARKRLARTPKA